jgi:uncharacterized protein (DUF58 family)
MRGRAGADGSAAGGPGADRYLIALTPAGAGFLSLFSPGLLVAAVTRQRLLIALSVAAGLMLLANALLAWLAVRTVAIDVRAPDTATVGHPLPIRLKLDGRRPVECVAGIDGATRPWIAATVPATGEVEVIPEHRGVVDRVGVRLQTAAPFGLTAWVRSVSVPLARRLHVGPPALAVDLPVELRPSAVAAAAGADPAEPVGLREYAFGDPLRDVHWPAVARSGRLVVKDRSRVSTSQTVAVFVDVDPGAETARVDEALGRARSVMEQLLASGFQIELTTVEPAASPASADATAGSITGAVVVGRVRPWWSPTGRRSTPAASGTETARRTVVTRRAVVERMAMVCGGRPDVASLAGVGRPGHDPRRTSNGEGPSGLAWAELTVTTEELRWRWPHH